MLFLAAALAVFPLLAKTAVPLVSSYRITPGPAQSLHFESRLHGLHSAGRTDQVSGRLTFDGVSVRRIHGRFDVALASLSTGSAWQDRRLRESVLQTTLYPTATFLLTPVALPRLPSVVGQTLSLTMHGMLSLHGVLRPLACLVQITSERDMQGRDSLHLVTQSVVRLEDFHMTAPRFFGLSLPQEQTLIADLHALPEKTRERVVGIRRTKP